LTSQPTSSETLAEAYTRLKHQDLLTQLAVDIQLAIPGHRVQHLPGACRAPARAHRLLGAAPRRLSRRRGE
jgi:hypothetical protein